MSSPMTSPTANGLGIAPSLGVGAIALGLSLVGLIARVPKGWWVLAPLVYVVLLFGLMLGTTSRRRAVFAAGLSFLGGLVGLLSIGAALVLGILGEPIDPEARIAMWIVASLYALVVLALLVSVLLPLIRPDSRSARLPRLSVGLAAVAIAMVQAIWVVRLYVA